MARTTARVNKNVQVKATAAAKRARLEEGGLRGPSVGAITSGKRKAQARRDAKSDAAAAAPAKKAKPAGGKSAAKSPPAAAAKARRGRGVPVVEVRTANAVSGSAGLDAFAER